MMQDFDSFEEYADSFWLAVQIAKVEGLDLSKYSPYKIEEEIPLPSNTPPPSQPGQQPPQPTNAAPIATGVILNRGEKKEDGNKRKIIGTGTLSSFPKEQVSPLSIQRGLRILKKRVPSYAVPPEVNTEETLYQLAKNRIAIHYAKKLNQKISIKSDLPVLRRARERWLDLVLVIDVSSPTMRFFEERKKVLRRVIEESGVFRTIQIYYLHRNPKDIHLPFISRSKDRLADAGNLLEKSFNQSQRKVFLFVSDCISPVWDSWTEENGIGETLRSIGRRNSVAIVQMLPESLWLRSGISRFEMCKAWTSEPLPKNKDMHLSVPPEKSRKGMGIPILTLNDERISAWANMVFGKTNPVLSIFLPDPDVKSEPKRHMDKVYGDMNVKDRVEVFIHTAPLQTKQLATCVAVVPQLSVETLQKLKDYMLPDAPVDTLADLVTSNVITLVDPDGDGIGYRDGNDAKRPLREMIPFEKTLETQANYYYYIADDNQKLRDKNGKIIDYWLYIDKFPYVSELIDLDNDGTRELHSVFSESLSFHLTGNLEIEPGGGDGGNGIPKVVQSNDFLGSVFSSRETLLRNEQPPAEQLNQIKEYQLDYLEMPHVDVSLWGDTGSGKTALILSMDRSLSVSKKGIELRTLDHYGNPHRSPFHFSKPERIAQTEKVRDYLYQLTGHSQYRNGLTVCFHDFPGRSTIELPEFVRTSYDYSDAVIICLPTDKLIFSNKQERVSAKKEFENFISWLDSRQRKPQLCVCLTKSDLEKSADTGQVWRDQWKLIENYLGVDMSNILQDSGASLHIVSAWGTAADWSPKRVCDPLLAIIEKTV